MNRLRLLCTLTWISGLLLLMITLVDILALTDISRDYVSQSVFEVLEITLPSTLPEWTDTRGEWLVATLTVYSSVGFLILNAITLGLIIKKLGRSSN